MSKDITDLQLLRELEPVVEQNINRHIAADRSANGGKLTPAEKKNINQRQNGASRQIYNEKHNGKTAPR